MTEYVEHLFNTCPECRPNGKRVFLEFKKGSDYTEPCRECGCKFGKILTPVDKVFNVGEGYRATSEGFVPMGDLGSSQKDNIKYVVERMP